MKPMTKLKQLNDLTLLDRFLFASVMEDEETLELALSIIMGEEVHLRQPNQVEKEFRTMPWLRSVRLDVYKAEPLLPGPDRQHPAAAGPGCGF